MALQEFRCPNCGGALSFEPGVQELLCPYCNSTINVEALEEYDSDLSGDQANESEDIGWSYDASSWDEGEQSGLCIYSCKSCGGEIVGDETLGATSCPFCGNPVVMTSKFSGDLKPDIVIPFKYSRDQALAALKQHYLGKRLLPKAFKDENHLEEVKGVYVPFWLFDADIDADMRYTAKSSRHWSDSKFRYTETSVYSVRRSGSLSFIQVPVDGSTVMDDTLMESIEPFYWADAIRFQTAYLAGFFANKYDVDSDHSTGRASQRIMNSTENVFRSTVTGYDSVTPERQEMRKRAGGIKYALLPVWMLSTNWNDENFVFAMNGQTGKFTGDLPLDKAARNKWFFGIFLGSFAALAAIALVVISLMP
jgi:DNA-directed RNA polymerase subunit RPC12/RpoP